MKNIKTIFQNDLAISIALHLAILLIFGLVFFEAPRQVTEAIVDLFTEPYSQFEPVKDNPGIQPGDMQSEQDEPAQADETIQPHKSDDNLTAIPTASTSSQSKEIAPPTKSDPTLPPNEGRNLYNRTSGTVPSSSFLTKLKGKLRGTGGSGSNFEFEDGDGSVSILSKVLPKSNITDYGKVTLQFKINADGSVVGESVIPILVDDAGYTKDSITALKQWKFEVKSFRANQIYKISFIFKPE